MAQAEEQDDGGAEGDDGAGSFNMMAEIFSRRCVTRCLGFAVAHGHARRRRVRRRGTPSSGRGSARCRGGCAAASRSAP